MRILRLTLTKRWFDMIASGEKKEEYRLPGKWILSRLEGKPYDVVEFRNGYGPNVPGVLVEYRGWRYSMGRKEWGADGRTQYVAIQLGGVIRISNAPNDYLMDLRCFGAAALHLPKDTSILG